ncbi:PTS sugar transporter subunit IIA [Corynebacterium frankenforstense]|uniref:PTS sugar transporter subunit IIA n=1 Tax=Corynebacterium TaxID=1716 RepID=UPI00254D32CE|nr:MULTISPECIES: PTS sugar transporter subunit IIA [Corynebacterium]MDK6260352.1 PTS sugar transporter subunit IIA [Corynebacterium frankenforstense]MDK8894683.1 PTS sugar transporter subunit IIA [Corynebacterium sp. MSK006]
MADLPLPDSRIGFMHASDWRAAVERSLGMLEAEGFITRNYIDTVIASVESGKGLYMALGQGLMLAHCRPEDGALETGISLVVLDEPVPLGDSDDHPVNLIWGLCANDSHAHQQIMAELAKVLMQFEAREALSAARDIEAVRAAIAAA